MKKLLFVLLILLHSMPLSAAQGFSSLEEQMTGEEFSAAGLDKLTAQERETLNQWIRSHSLATLATPAAAATEAAAPEQATGDRRGFPDADDDEDRAPITSRIVGKFSGWDGQSVFRLENGMIWEQTDKDKFYIREVENPVAIIERGMFGIWRLHIEGHDSECRVKRIQ
jgi:hypothetical protein